MCGIFGYFNFDKKSFSQNEKLIEELMKSSYSRGKEASGFAFLEDNTISVIKSDLSGKSLLKSNEYKSLKSNLKNKLINLAIGHSRLATHGTQLNSNNNQPIISDDENYTMIHNGIITNCELLWELMGLKTILHELDSKVLLDFIIYKLKNQSVNDVFRETFNIIEGTVSLALVDVKSNQLFLSTNTGSLYYVFDPNNKLFFFASEFIFLKNILKKIKLFNCEIIHLKPNNLVQINSIGVSLIDLTENVKNGKIISQEFKEVKFNNYVVENLKSEASRLYTFKNDISILKKHKIDFNRINSIKRCVKCILPFTTPFIKFDENGICNYCTDHSKITYKGIDELREKIKKLNLRNDGKPNCLAAFSGGRDSSYGLHFLKKELGLEPLAYTYDWGMVTDIARENQARILGKLGVEHIIVSADITKKRKHIHENIKAWMKDPHLGMVPLFMEGDKQCEFYADRLMKNYNLELMFFFRGNELEKDEFKTGHCGVSDADPNGVIHNLALTNKIKLLSFYASRYVKNPAYFNSSFFDTSLGFFSTYIQPHNYLYLWHYIKWDEKKIVDTLRNEYNWKVSSETNQTWRTDDGTSAFYNYIYYQVQGFTENDSFRSRQIREGLITRELALELVHEENKPRYESLKWYFDKVGLDGHEVLSVVDFMKKLY